MVLALDLREAIADSAAAPASILTPRRATVMDVVLGLETPPAATGGSRAW